MKAIMDRLLSRLFPPAELPVPYWKRRLKEIEKGKP